MKSKKAEYNTAYNKANTVVINIRLNKKTDADIIEALSDVGNKSKLVKDLLRLNGYGDRDIATGLKALTSRKIKTPTCLKDPERRAELLERYKEE